MICPECGSEYRDGFYKCSDCEVPLVEAPSSTPVEAPFSAPDPSEPRFADRKLVTILDIVDPAIVPIAKSLLEDADIPYLMKGEGLQGLFGLGQIGMGFNPISGPVELQVQEERREEALDLLSQLDSCEILDDES